MLYLHLPEKTHTILKEKNPGSLKSIGMKLWLETNLVCWSMPKQTMSRGESSHFILSLNECI